LPAEIFAVALARIAAEPAADRPSDAAGLTRWIYERHYALIGLTWGKRPPPKAEAGTWAGGWRVVEVLRDGALMVDRGGSGRIVVAGSYRRSGAARAAQPGDRVEIWIVDWSDHVSPGFRYYFGRPRADCRDLLGRRRFYFNARADRRLAFSSRLAQSLRRSELAFTLKAERDPRVERLDGVVLYVDLPASPWTCIVLAHALAESQGDVSDATSPFALRLGPGVAAADAPGSGESFGMYVSGRIAEALLNLGEGGTEIGRLQRFRRALRVAGLDLKAPWRLHRSTPFPIEEAQLV
jgi:hypothetical protein